MTTLTVADVMTIKPVTVEPETRYQHIVNLLIEYGISAVPVLDDTDRVLGVVSEADLAAKVEFAATWPAKHGRSKSAQRQSESVAKARAESAAELMTAPTVTIDGAASVTAAARAMAAAKVKRLPVVDADGRLIGIVSRRDLLLSMLAPGCRARHTAYEP